MVNLLVLQMEEKTILEVRKKISMTTKSMKEKPRETVIISGRIEKNFMFEISIEINDNFTSLISIRFNHFWLAHCHYYDSVFGTGLFPIGLRNTNCEFKIRNGYQIKFATCNTENRKYISCTWLIELTYPIISYNVSRCCWDVPAMCQNLHTIYIYIIIWNWSFCYI